MAIVSVGTLGTAAEGGSSDSTLALVTSATLNANNVGVLAVASDNAGASGNTSHHTSVTDGASNTYSKIYEYTYSPGSSAADGVTVSIWVVRPASDFASGGTVTINQSGNTAEKCASFWEFTSGAALQKAGTQQTEGANTNHPTSLTIGSLSSKEYLFFRVVGKEVNTTTALTPTTNYTAITGTRSRNNSAAITIRGEFRILTGTGDTSSPTMNTISDTASIYVALEEVASGTQYNQAVSGTVTPDGAAVRQTNKVTAGAVTPDGAVVRRTSKITAGTVTPDGGLLKRIGKILAGALTPDGALAAVKTALIALGGTLTPAGELAKRTAKAVAGTVTPDGALIKSIRKVVAGVLNWAGDVVGDLISGGTQYTQAVAGTLNASGEVVKRTAKALAGTLAPDGGLVKRIAKAMAGVLTPAGDLIATFTGVVVAAVGKVELHLRAFLVNAVRPYHDPAALNLPDEPVNPVKPYHDPAKRTLKP